MQDLSSAIRSIPDFPKPGILFRDITTMLKDGKLFQQVVNLFAERYTQSGITAVVGIESRGFLFASALAYRLECGIIPIRKKGKLPSNVYRETYDLEYGQDTIEIHQDALPEGSRVVLIDDLLATGGTMAAAVRLLKQFPKIEIVEVSFLIELSDLHGRDQLKGVNVFSVLKF